ncbi:MAG: NAD-dependent epimerase/dehydratase family protein [Flavobacterium sp.]|jgi:dihydroflavonol-4-reductase
MILVTGGTGLVGAHLLLYLIESESLGVEKIRAIYRNSSTIEKTKSLFELYNKLSLFDAIEWVQGDIIDVPTLEHAFKGIDYVYHSAALISFDPKNEDLLRKTNIEGTANIVNFCLAKGVKKLCYISSTAALGDLAGNETIITEEIEWNPEKPHSDYAISKYGAEMEIWRGQQEGLNVIIVNPGIIIGPGFQEQGSGQLFKEVANGLRYYTMGKGAFVTVSDVVRMAIELMRSNTRNERFVLVAQTILYRDVLNTIADALKVKRPTRHLKPYMMEIGWRLDWFLSKILSRKRQFTRATAKASYSNYEYSNEKIKRTLNTEFLDVHQYIREISSL